MGKTRLFYKTATYRAKQSEITRRNWELGKFNFLLRKIARICSRRGCGVCYQVVKHDPKKYCSQRCAAISNNTGRKMSEAAKRNISRALLKKYDPHRGYINPFKGVIKVPRREIICGNPQCGKRIFVAPWKKTKYCSVDCSMRVIGSRPTSPKASKGKNGIRRDVSSTINFYSRWEANIARLYTHLRIRWQYAPKSFDIGGQKYTPDFYLPDTDTYIEVKNFWWSYSRMRDEKFRQKYPDVRLKVILKDEYTHLEKKYAHLIPNWEYKNSSHKDNIVYALAAKYDS